MRKMSGNFRSVLEGATFLLGDTCRLLNEIEAEYVIVGGWTPYLLNKTDIVHPGTRDVDILFKDAYIEGNIAHLIKAFLRNGFVASAKHDFQLLRTLEFGSHSLVYNIDLLHPSESKKNFELFVDHFDLGIPTANGVPEGKMVRSIVIPETDLIFDGMSEDYYLEYRGVDRAKNQVRLPLMNHLGLLISKADSVTNVKRKRDSFDIYLILQQPEFDLRDAIERSLGGNKRLTSLMDCAGVLERMKRPVEK